MITVAASLLAGCSKSTDGHSKTTTSTTGKTSAGIVIKFPLDSYFPSAAEDESVDRAEYLLIKRCAAGYGIKLPGYPGPPDPGTPALTFQVQYLGNLRPITVADATAFGYQQGTVGPGPIMGDDSPPSSDKDTDPYRGLSTSELLIAQGWMPDLYPGVPKPTNSFVLKGGCAGAARRSVGDTRPLVVTTDPKHVDDYNYVFGLIQESTSRAQATSKFINAQQKWSACMARNGYPRYTTVLSAITHFDLNAATTKEQTATAIQDAKCKIEVGMVRLWIDSVRANQEQILNKDSLQLAAVEQRTQKRVRTAAAVLAKN